MFGTGPRGARLMFVGEMPGEQENNTGIPFAGRSGELLDKIIRAMKLERGKVYLTNVVKCATPKERKPKKAEAEACRSFLETEIECVAPDVIVPLGMTAWKWFAPGEKRKMGDVRGGLYRITGIGGGGPDGSAVLAPTYHPAFLLRIPAHKRDVWRDMQEVMGVLEHGPPPDAEVIELARRPSSEDGGPRAGADLFSQTAGLIADTTAAPEGKTAA